LTDLLGIGVSNFGGIGKGRDRDEFESNLKNSIGDVRRWFYLVAVGLSRAIELAAFSKG
jgi:hypothetical protein